MEIIHGNLPRGIGNNLLFELWFAFILSQQLFHISLAIHDT